MTDGMRRRELLAGGLGAAAAGTLAGAETAQGKSGRRPPGRPRTYVVVVGAGLAGLSAATAIRSAGRSVLVLEARRRVGGRNFDHKLAPGKVAELGGEWTGPGQTVIRGLVKELGVDTFPTYAKGKNVYYSNGHVQTYTGGIPPASPPTLVELEAIIVELNRMAKSVPAGAAWKAPQATAWDQQTCAGSITQHTQSAEGRNLAELAIRGVYGEEAKQISLLDLLQAISGVGGDFNTLIGSAQSIHSSAARSNSRRNWPPGWASGCEWARRSWPSTGAHP